MGNFRDILMSLKLIISNINADVKVDFKATLKRKVIDVELKFIVKNELL